MKLKNERTRQIIFLVLVISGTLILYSSRTSKLENTDRKEFVNAKTEGSFNKINDHKDADTFFGIFINNPNSIEGIDALFISIEFWDKAGKDSLIESAINNLEMTVQNDSLKEKFYSRLGKYYADVNRNSKSKFLEKLLKEIYPR